MLFNFTRKAVLGLFMLGLGFGLLTPATRAADENAVAGLVVSPPLTEKEVNPGNTFDGKVKITNPNANTDLSVDISIQDFKANGENGEQTFVDPAENQSFSLGTWVSIESNVVLKANEVKEIPYTVNIPANAEPGGHYGVIFFVPKTLSSNNINGSGVMTVPKIGSLLLFTVPGEISYSGTIKEFTINNTFFSNSSNKVLFTTRFENTGSNHVKPQGSIVIKNVLGKEVANINVNEKMGNVLPQSIRKFENEWDKKYGFGLYKASATLAFGENGTATSELSFWIVPWKETAGAVVLLILLIWILSHLKWSGKKSSPEPVVASQPATEPSVQQVQQTPQQTVTTQPTVNQYTQPQENQTIQSTTAPEITSPDSPQQPLNQ